MSSNPAHGEMYSIKHYVKKLVGDLRQIGFLHQWNWLPWYNWRVWRYQRGNQNPYIEEEQTTQWPKEKVQKDKQRYIVESSAKPIPLARYNGRTQEHEPQQQTWSVWTQEHEPQQETWGVWTQEHEPQQPTLFGWMGSSGMQTLIMKK